MKCLECGRDAILVKKSRVLYKGIKVENVYLQNVEVEVCRPCGSESLVLRNLKKVHAMIALGIALQPAKLAGSEVRFLRKAIRMSVAEWAPRMGIATETFSRWENGRSPAQQVEKLARIDFLSTTSTELTSKFDLQEALTEIFSADLVKLRDFAIVIDAENLDSIPQYPNLRSTEFAKPTSARIEASVMTQSKLAKVRLYGGGKVLVASDHTLDGENLDACLAFAAAA